MYGLLQGGGLSLWGLIPAVAMEGIFALRSYKKHDYWTIVLATVLAATASSGVTFVRWSYLPVEWIVVNLIAAFLGGSIAYAIGRVLGK